MDHYDINSGIDDRVLCLQDKNYDDKLSKMETMPGGRQGDFERTRPELLKELKDKLLEYGRSSLTPRRSDAAVQLTPDQMSFSSRRMRCTHCRSLLRGTTRVSRIGSRPTTRW